MSEGASLDFVEALLLDGIVRDAIAFGVRAAGGESPAAAELGVLASKFYAEMEVSDG